MEVVLLYGPTRSTGSCLHKSARTGRMMLDRRTQYVIRYHKILTCHEVEIMSGWDQNNPLSIMTVEILRCGQKKGEKIHLDHTRIIDSSSVDAKRAAVQQYSAMYANRVASIVADMFPGESKVEYVVNKDEVAIHDVFRCSLVKAVQQEAVINNATDWSRTKRLELHNFHLVKTKEDGIVQLKLRTTTEPVEGQSRGSGKPAGRPLESHSQVRARCPDMPQQRVVNTALAKVLNGKLRRRIFPD